LRNRYKLRDWNYYKLLKLKLVLKDRSGNRIPRKVSKCALSEKCLKSQKISTGKQ